jgi:hypothetical protein
LFVLSAKNWNNYVDHARILLGGNPNINSFDDFCNEYFETTTNNKTWVTFFGFKVGGYENIVVIPNTFDFEDLAIIPAFGDWFYGWNDEEVDDAKALKMSDNTFNPYLDLRKIRTNLETIYNQL